MRRLFMKKWSVLILLVATLTACSSSITEKKLPIEMIAHNSLSDEEQLLIPTSPKDSLVTKEAVSAKIKAQFHSTYKQQQVYSVVFNGTDTATAGNLIVYVDLDQKTVVGKAFQELD
ncbi:hypothetical protein FQ085_16050 [Planococcus sp. ANT_H30]|nr:hypothetical protein FQ085_16050 [Planococcus sp. ANT_H30]